MVKTVLPCVLEHQFRSPDIATQRVHRKHQQKRRKKSTVSIDKSGAKSPPQASTKRRKREPDTVKEVCILGSIEDKKSTDASGLGLDIIRPLL